MWMFEQKVGQMRGKSSPAVRIPYRNRSGMVESVGGSPWCSPELRTVWQIFAETPLPFWILTQFFYSKFKFWNNSFQWETSNFLWPRKNQHFGGEGITAKLPSHCTSWGIYKHAPTAFWRKRRLLYWKKGGHKKRFSQGGYMQGTSSPP